MKLRDNRLAKPPGGFLAVLSCLVETGQLVHFAGGVH